MVQVPSGASPKNTLAPLLAAVAPPAMEVNRKVVIDAKSFLTVEMTLDLVTTLGLGCPLGTCTSDQHTCYIYVGEETFLQSKFIFEGGV